MARSPCGHVAALLRHGSSAQRQTKDQRRATDLAFSSVCDQIADVNCDIDPLQTSPLRQGMPRWRQRQRDLPVAEKVELLGRFIQETRRLEGIKKSCKPSVTSSNNCSPTGH
jgi:hypothetical protein